MRCSKEMRILGGLSLIIGAVLSVTIIYAGKGAIGAPPETFERILSDRIPPLLISTFSLVFAVTVIAIFFGITSAYIIVKSDFPFKKIFRWLFALPLMIPPYIGAFAYIRLFGPRQAVESFIASNFIEGFRLPSIYGFWSVALILAIFTYPYVYLLVASSLKELGDSYEEASLGLGLGQFRTFIRITLPLIRPAIAVSGLMVGLYVLSDFGAISMLRYNSFTSAIHMQLVGRYDRSAASILSLVLSFISVFIIYLEGASRSKIRYSSSRVQRKTKEKPLGKMKLPSIIFAVILAGLGFIIPFGSILWWTIVSLSSGADISRIAALSLNSLKVSLLAGLVGTIIAFPIVYYYKRGETLLGKIIYRMAFSGYAVPGVVAALGIVAISLDLFPSIYRTVAIVVFAMVVRFVPKAIQSQEASLSRLSKGIEEASRMSGKGFFYTIFKIVLPSIKGGLLSGLMLVFVSSMKELPATLLLRPAGFDTLATRIWMDTSEGFYTNAGPYSLILILLSIYPVKLLLQKNLGGN